MRTWSRHCQPLTTRSDDSGSKEDGPGKRKMSALEAIREANEEKKRAKLQTQDVHTDHWLAPVRRASVMRRPDALQGIVVRIIHKDLAGGKFYKQKAVVLVRGAWAGCTSNSRRRCRTSISAGWSVWTPRR